MNRYKILLLTAIVGLSIPLLVAPAPAWEFSMDGVYTWEFEYRGQGGKDGFFGPYDVDWGSGTGTVPGAGTLAPENFWLGFHQPGNDRNGTSNNIGSSFASGSEGSWNTIYMNTNMQIRMNQALRVRGKYYIGSWYDLGANINTGWPASPATFPGTTQPSPWAWGNTVASEYISYGASGVQRSFSPGYWETLWLTAELPWGIITLGKRPSTWGTGLGWNGEESRSSESLAITVPYGPFRIQLSAYLSRRGTTNGSYYNQDYDKNNARWWDIGIPTLTYRQGPVDSGILLNMVSRHVGREGFLGVPGTTGRTQYPSTDFDEFYGGVYFMYNNGRFFFNTELDWDHTTNRHERQRDVANQSLVAAAGGSTAASPYVIRDLYSEHWRFMAETGVISGPAKVSLLYAWLPGPDRRNGAQIDRTGLQTLAGIRSNSWSNTGLFRPYSYLMVYSYGLGTHMNADTRNGTVEDASILAARMDYAVASNLNVYGSFLWADRTNVSGYGWGFIRPYTTTPYNAVTWDDRGPSGGPSNRCNPFTTPAGTSYEPNIPDPNLGYEIGAGMDWKLLEGLTVNLTCSYWKPGKWFSYACIDKRFTNWDIPAGGPFGWGVFPERNIDPVWGLELKVVGDF